jgi:glyoxylase-like metal-dependent hydrolase (beta-lactamase superfamily II)
MGKRMEVTPGIHWIEGINGNCYLLVDESLTLIDTGLPRKAKKILRYITNTLHRSPSELTTIILTHFHPDHIGNAAQLRMITGAKLAAHSIDAIYIEGKRQRPVPKGAVGWILNALSPLMAVPSFTIDISLKDQDTIAGLLVIDSPGHTPGSISLYDVKRKALFTGDTLRYLNGAIEGPSERFSLDIVTARLSIQKFKDLEFNVMLGGHGDPLIQNATLKVREFIQKQ